MSGRTETEMLKTKVANSSLRCVVKRLLCLALLDASFAVFAFIFLDKSFPITEGWGINYSELMMSGEMPYRDFYYYSMPLNLFVDAVLWTLSTNRFLIYRILRLCEGLLVLDLLFLELSRTKYGFRPWTVWASVFMGGVFGYATVYELCGDYNQTMLLLFVCLGIAVSHYFDAKIRSNSSKRIAWCFVAGLTTGILVLLKIPAGFAAAVCFSLLLAAYSIKQRDLTYLQDLLLVAAISLIPIFICGTWLVSNGALDAFFDQAFGSSKGNTEMVLVGSLFNYLKVNSIIVGLALIVCGLSQTCLSARNRHEFPFLAVVLSLSAALVLYGVNSAGISSLLLSVIGSKTTLILLVLAAVPPIISYILERRLHTGAVPSAAYIAYYAFLFAAASLLVSVNYRGISVVLYEWSSGFSLFSIITQFTFAFLVIYQVASFLVNGSEGGFQEGISGLAVAAVAAGYASLMGRAGEGTVDTHAMMIMLPPLLVLAFQTIDVGNIARDSLLMTVLSLFVLLCGSQKAVSSYAWWGWTEEPVWESRTESTIPMLEGFQLTYSQEKMYEEICTIIQKNGSENSTVFGFPQNVIFNILTGHQQYDWFVPVVFYDVCSDSYAELAASLLEANPPDFIIWCDIPNCMSVHEALFRGGEQLGQRDIQRWFAGAAEKSYTLVGQAGNLFIYQRSEQVDESSYTYIEDINAVNETAIEGSS